MNDINWCCSVCLGSCFILKQSIGPALSRQTGSRSPKRIIALPCLQMPETELGIYMQAGVSSLSHDLSHYCSLPFPPTQCATWNIQRILNYCDFPPDYSPNLRFQASDGTENIRNPLAILTFQEMLSFFFSTTVLNTSWSHAGSFFIICTLDQRNCIPKPKRWLFGESIPLM